VRNETVRNKLEQEKQIESRKEDFHGSATWERMEDNRLKIPSYTEGVRSTERERKI